MWSHNNCADKILQTESSYSILIFMHHCFFPLSSQLGETYSVICEQNLKFFCKSFPPPKLIFSFMFSVGYFQFILMQSYIIFVRHSVGMKNGFNTALHICLLTKTLLMVSSAWLMLAILRAMLWEESVQKVMYLQQHFYKQT